MSKNIYRNFLIGAVTLIALVSVYPTLGWMALSEPSRQARMEKWRAEDDQMARIKPTYLQKELYRWKRWAEFDRTKVINLGLDLQGGIHMVIGFDIKDMPEEKLKQYRDRSMSDADIEREVQKIVLEQVRTRVDKFEAKEPVIQALGTNQIQIQLPGEKDLQRAKNLITKTAQLKFQIVAGADESKQVYGKIIAAFPQEFKDFVKISSMQADRLTVTQENFDRVKRVLEKAVANGVIPAEKMVAFSQKPKAYDKDQLYQLYVIDKKPIATGEGLTSATAIPDQSNPPFWQILFEFDAAAADNFATGTEANKGNPMAIVLDDVVMSAPVIRERISSRGSISGQFEAEEAKDLAIALNSGSMEVPVREEFTRTISASLGLDAVRKGIDSSLGSMLIVALFMLVYYLRAGVIAVISLMFNTLFLLALMAYFNLTLTLPGIAGLVLTTGIAVDANVLIYERIREELKLGHTLMSSMENGFKRAASVIIDAHVTTLIAGAILMQFGTGPIKGFAVTLNIGVATTLFCALVLTPALFELALRYKLLPNLKMFSVFPHKPNIPFMQWRFVVMAVTLSAIAIGMTYFFIRGADNYGVDFRQGTNLSLYIENSQVIPDEELRNKLTDAGFVQPVVQGTQDDTKRNNLFIIRVGDTTRSEAAKESAAEQKTLVTVSDRIRNALAPLAEGGSVDKIVVDNEQTVGPAVGSQLRWDALKAIFFSILLIIIYLWVRFELRFSIGAVVALVHDLLFTVGLFSIVGGEISMGMIAAILTIIGYSLNDTIIVFDRVREDMQVYRGKGVKFEFILNDAINSTLSRTIITSLTVLFVTVVLLVFGGESLWDFAFVLTVGVAVGTYSSIFIASPIVYWWDDMHNKRVARLQAAKQLAGGGKDDSSRKRSVKAT
jgi:SecD/SecF fusion protein